MTKSDSSPESKIKRARAYLSKVPSIEGSHGASACFGACCALFNPEKIGFSEAETEVAWDLLVEWNRSSNVQPPWDEEIEHGPDSLKKKFVEAMGKFIETTANSAGTPRPSRRSGSTVDLGLQQAVLAASNVSIGRFLTMKPTRRSSEEIIEAVFPDGCSIEDTDPLELKAAQEWWDNRKKLFPGLPYPKEMIWIPLPGQSVAPLLSVGWAKNEFCTLRRDQIDWNQATFIVPNPCRSWMGMKQDSIGAKVPAYSAHAKTQIAQRDIIITEWDKNALNQRYSLAEQVAFGTYLMAYAPLLWATISGSNKGDGSIHWAWLCRGIPEEIVGRVFDFALKLGADYKMEAPFQFTRVPNGWNSETQRRQTCLYFDEEVLQ